MKPKTARRESGTTARIVVKRTDSSGRILYDVGSILSSDAAKRHFEALRRALGTGRTDRRTVPTESEG